MQRTKGHCHSLLRTVSLGAVFIAVSALTAPIAHAQGEPSPKTAVVHVDVNPKHILNSFDPDRALGSSVDVLSHNGIDHVYTPHILQESLSAGWGPITYRNNTELAHGRLALDRERHVERPRAQERILHRQH